jgi:tRNA (mo5U34)-methyltransferase
MNADELRARVGAIRWFHRMDLGGVVTPGVTDCAVVLERLCLPDLRGRTVLDIGAWDGFYSFEAERRGASRVLATDSFSWGGGGWGTKAGFELAREALGSRVEDLTIDVMDLAPDRTGQFDVVFLLGVLYHLRDPLRALERVASVTRECLVLETVVDLVGYDRPAMVFYPGRELNADPTNWWGPNVPALEAMLRTVGFARTVSMTPRRSRPYRALRAVYHRARRRNTMRQAYNQDRAVVHAFTS